MRLFCGIEIPESIKASLRALTGRLKPLAKLSWSPIENLHVTTKFIGEWPEERIEEMQRTLDQVSRSGTIDHVPRSGTIDHVPRSGTIAHVPRSATIAHVPRSGTIDHVPRSGTIDIAVRGLGWFPNERNPRVFWAGIEATEALERLARDTEKSVAALGVPVEERGFHPHLTLARRRDPVPIETLRKEVAAISVSTASTDFGHFLARSFILYLSKGGRYTRLQEYPF